MTSPLLQRISAGLVGHAAIYIGAAGVNAAIPFLLLPLVARWLGPSDFGVIGSFVAVANVLILLVGLNAYGFVSVGYFRDGPQTLPRLVGAAVAIILGASIVVGVAGWAGAGVVERLTQIDRRWLWTLLAAATGQAILALGLAVAQTLRRPFVYGAVQIGYSLLLGVMAIVLVGVFAMGWPGRALAQAVAALAAAAGVLVWLYATGRITKAVGREKVRGALRFGMPLLPHSFAAVAMGSMDRLALGGTFAPAIVGQYFLALQVSSIFTAVAAAANQAWVPWLYERLARNEDLGWTQITRAIRVGGALLAGAAVAMAVFASPLVQLVGGKSYLAATTPLRLLAFYTALQAWYTLMSAFLFYAERTRLLSMLTVSIAIVQAALVVVCVRWGPAGVAAALLISAMVGALAVSLIVRHVAARLRLAPRAAPAIVAAGV